MRRVYLKPEIRTVQLCLNTFITASGNSNSNGTNWGLNDGTGSDKPVNDATDPIDDAPSRWFRDDIWND